MIHEVSANQPTFHRVRFTAGLNVVLADRTDVSTQKDTRNGLGKSTLLAIIDFCLGANAIRDRGLWIEPLLDWSFSLLLTVGGNTVRVTRAVKSPGRLHIEGPTDGWVRQPDDHGDGSRSYSVADWRTVLGAALFALGGSEERRRYHPTFRSLLPYFLRRGLDAYVDPFRHYRSPKSWTTQVNVAYLLGLNWEYAAQWQELRDTEQATRALNAAIRSGAIPDLGTAGELEAEAINLQAQVDRQSNALRDFRVHPQYEAIQSEADQLTAELHELSNQNVADRRRLAQYRAAIEQEGAPADVQLEEVYREAGLVFPAPLRRTLDEARDFHRNIVANRRKFLEVELARVARAMATREEQIGQLTDRRASVLNVLATHGALEELTALQGRLVELKGRLAEVQDKLAQVRSLAKKRREVAVARAELSQVAAREHEERRGHWAEAVRLFNENSQALYNTPGRLVIDVGDAGYRFDVEIERSGSEGVGKMKVFCFDLTLLQLWADAPLHIDFLIHDSVLFDGVDSRQRALALARAASVADEIGAQYICTLNSDAVPFDEFPVGFNFNDHVRLVLRDRHPSERLLGFEFDQPYGRDDAAGV